MENELAAANGQISLPQSKFPTTIDIKFDNNNTENVVKDEAINKYQENAYLLGKIFNITS